MVGVIWMVAAAAVVTAHASKDRPGWNVGWAFVSHGGFPALPAGWPQRSYRLNSSLVGYFLGNASGMNSAEEVRAEDRLGVVGIGWQINNIPSHHSHLEQFEEETARQLKAIRPDVKAMALRNTEVATVFWDAAKSRMEDPTTQDFWTQCDGKPCEGAWVSPAGNTPKYYFNFSNPRLRDWWVYEFVGGALNNSAFDGVYFDCSCGDPPGDHLDQDAMQADAQIAFDMALRLAASKDKWASDWNNDGHLSKLQCRETMLRWLDLGTQPNRTLQIQSLALRGKGSWPGFCGTKPLSCNDATEGHDLVSDGILEAPYPTRDKEECCARCEAHGGCEAFIMGPSNCYLVSGVRGDYSTVARNYTCVRPEPTELWLESERNRTIAAFLIARGPSAILEFPMDDYLSFEGASRYGWSPLFELDFGTPVEKGTEVSPGVFQRRWSEATVTLDCNAYTSKFYFDRAFVF